MYCIHAHLGIFVFWYHRRSPANIYTDTPRQSPLLSVFFLEKKYCYFNIAGQWEKTRDFSREDR